MVEPMVKRCAGLDVHKMQIMVTVLLEQSDGQLQESTREFGTFQADRLALADRLNGLNIELVVMERTGVYWKSIFSTLTQVATYAAYAMLTKPKVSTKDSPETEFHKEGEPPWTTKSQPFTVCVMMC